MTSARRPFDIIVFGYCAIAVVEAMINSNWAPLGGAAALFACWIAMAFLLHGDEETRRDRWDQSTLRHPWRWSAATTTLLALVFVVMIGSGTGAWLDVLAIVAAVAIPLFLFGGWSSSRGPARRSIEKRKARRESDLAAALARPPDPA